MRRQRKTSPDPAKVTITHTATVVQQKEKFLFTIYTERTLKGVLTSEGGKAKITNIRELTV